MKPANVTLGLRLRVVLERDIAIGPGKADLLEGIAATGSISAAGRRMKMSYKRAWTLAEALNAMFPEPLIESARGGAQGGGAAAAAKAKVAVVFVRDFESEERDRVALKLPQNADQLIRAVAAANPRTVVVLATGYDDAVAANATPPNRSSEARWAPDRSRRCWSDWPCTATRGSATSASVVTGTDAPPTQARERPCAATLRARTTWPSST